MTPAPAATSRRWTIGVVAVVALAGALRAWGLGAGVPFRMAADEPAVLGTVLNMLRSGDLNPHFFDYGGLIFYLHIAVAAVGFLAGARSGRWLSLDDLWVGDLLVPARIATLVLAMLTVVLVWRAGLRWGRGIALLAAFALAIQPQHVRESHFALTDVPLTCLVTLTLLLSLRASESGRTRAFAAAGLAAGAAAAIKYNGALALTMPLVAALAAPGMAAGAQAMSAALGAALLGFLAGAPYTLLDLPGFLNGFAVLMQSYNQPRPALDAARTYLQHIRNGFSVPGVVPLDLGWLAVSVSGLGMLAIAGAMRHRSTRVAALVTLVFPICYFWLISTQGSLLYGRYLLPMIPMGCIFLAAGMALIRDRIGRPGAPSGRLVPAVLALVLLPPLATSILFDVGHARIGTAEQAGHWILQNVGADDQLVVEMAAVRLPPRLRTQEVVRLIDRTMDDYRTDGATYLVATSAASDRFPPDPALRQRSLGALQSLMRAGQVVATFPATRAHPGDTVTIVRVPR